jgi:SAM-dependent methyltransferase
VKEDFEKQARIFELGESYFWFAAQNTLVEWVLEKYLAQLNSGIQNRPPRILDLGCGPGNALCRLGRRGVAIGMDFSLDALAFARSKGKFPVLSADATALPFASASVDCVVALDVLEHVEDDEKALAEITRVLRPGGVFIFTVPAFMGLWRHHDVMYGHFRRYAKRDLLERIGRAHLTVHECRFFKCMFFFPLWAVVKMERWAILPARDNFYEIPRWLNRVMEREIVWEERLGLTRLLPFGVSLLCVGRR